MAVAAPVRTAPKPAVIPSENGLQLPRWLPGSISREHLLYAGIVLGAFTLRIWDVGARAMHHDESLHATYAWYLFKGQGYSYNPVMHGPLQFFVMALFYLLFGDSETTARLFAVLCGTGLVILPYFLRPHLGRQGALIASIALAISPAFLYYSRFARDDVYLDFFSLLMVVAIWGFLRTRRRSYIYLLACSAALAMTTMEAAYITFFVFATFFLALLSRDLLSGGAGGALPAAVREVGSRTWIRSGLLFVAVVVLFYSSFFTNPYGLWDPRYGLMSGSRQDILGGLLYWQTQHGVARGGQPWFYYLLLFPLYEQFAVIFGLAGALWALLRRHLFTAFLLYWAVMSLVVYSWAGEKMPWLFLHPLLPAIVLAAAFAGRLLERVQGPGRRAVLTLLGILLVLEIHSAQALTYADGANPTEMLIYVQTSNDVPMVASEVIKLLPRLSRSQARPLIEVDSADLQGWPFEWYFRNLPPRDVSYTSTFAGARAPVLIMLSPENGTYSAPLRSRYVVARYRWNWWFPEDYKGLTFDHGMCGTATKEVPCPSGQEGTTFQRTGSGNVQAFPAIDVWPALVDASTWHHLWNWFVFRTPFGQRGARLLYLYVRKDIAPAGAGSVGQSPVVPTPAPGRYLSLAFRELAHFGASGGPLQRLTDPRGLAASNAGKLYVADALAHRISMWSLRGRFLGSFGQAGSGPGQFNPNLSPMDAAVGKNGRIYVADWWGDRVEMFGPAGRFQGSWGHAGSAGNNTFYGPRSLAVAPNGNIYVADTGNEQIAVFSPSGRFLFRFGGRGPLPGQFDEPSAVAVAPNGQVYVADMWNQRIERFSSRGGYLSSWSVKGWAFGSYQEPYIAVLHDGVVAVTDPQNDRVLFYGPEGRALGQIHDPSLTLPTGIAALPGNRVAVSDATAGQVYILKLLNRLNAPLG